jgi:hypothetical protein
MSASRRRRSPRSVAAASAVIVAGLVSGACNEVPSNLVEEQPYKLETIKGTDIKRVKLADVTARKIDLQTASVREEGNRKVVPHASLIYNPEGDVFVYTRPEAATYVRVPVKVRRVVGQRAVLSEGPPSGTTVVTVGAAELLATEYEILNQHP